MTRPVFGIDRDPLAAATWGDLDPGFEDADGGWHCELHGDDPDACRAYEAEQVAEMRITEMLADALLGDDR